MGRPTIDPPQDEHLQAAVDRLMQRGIVPENGRYTSRQLARELARRGWRWRIEESKVQADKAYTYTGTVSQSLISRDPDGVTALTLILAEAIRFDEDHGLSLLNPIQADIVMRAPDQRIVTLAEVKGGSGYTRKLAAELRRRLIVQSRDFSLAPFFLLITPDEGYLWDQRAETFPWSQPSVTFPLGQVVSHYLPWRSPVEQLSETELTAAVTQWLTDLARDDPLRPASADQSFAGTEFVDTIRGASVATEAFA